MAILAASCLLPEMWRVGDGTTISKLRHRWELLESWMSIRRCLVGMSWFQALTASAEAVFATLEHQEPHPLTLQHGDTKWC